MIACPKCALEWEPNCEQTRCIERFGECVKCRFVKPGDYNPHGSGEGTEEELAQIALKGADSTPPHGSNPTTRRSKNE